MIEKRILRKLNIGPSWEERPICTAKCICLSQFHNRVAIHAGHGHAIALDGERDAFGHEAWGGETTRGV